MEVDPAALDEFAWGENDGHGREELPRKIPLKDLFLHAVVEGDEEAVSKLISERFPYKDLVFDFSKLVILRPLALAARYGQIEIVKVLLKKIGNKLDLEDCQDACLELSRGEHLNCMRSVMELNLFKCKEHKICSELINASKSRNIDQNQVSLSAKKIDKGMLKKCGRNLMAFLIIYECPSSCLQALIKLGVDANGHDGNGFTPLMCAVLAKNTECVKFLLEFGVDVNARNKHSSPIWCGKTALMYAAARRDTKCLEMICEYCTKEEIDFETDFSICSRAIHIACVYGSTGAVLMLLESGAEAEVFDDKNNPIIAYAAVSENIQCMKFVLNVVSKSYIHAICESADRSSSYLVKFVNILRVLLDRLDGDVDVASSEGETLLTLAAQHGYIESARLLLDRGANINFAPPLGNTALMSACIEQSDMVQFLIAQGADVNIHVRCQKLNAVMLATQKQNVEALTYLLEAGANLDSVIFDRDTVFTMAMAGKERCMRLLLNTGELLEGGVLKKVHRDMMKRRWDGLSSVNYSVAMIRLLMEARVFYWDWCSEYTLRKTAFAAVHSGIHPGKIWHDNIDVSPLVFAFKTNDFATAKFLLANLYFLPEDYRLLCKSKPTDWGFCHYPGKLFPLLGWLTLQPLSLQTWSFLAVSNALVHAAPSNISSREEQVNSLPLHEDLKRILKFQSIMSRVCREYWEQIENVAPGALVFNSIGQVPHRPCSPRCFFCKGLGTCL